MAERTPLLNYRLYTAPEPASSGGGSRARNAGQQPPPKKLSTFFGVVIPTLLSMFSVVLFLRLGFVVGQAGLYQSILMFIVAYFIISMTVLSVCAISTNGALDAGGAYYMISRALGPEFGGSIGIMFFFANICGSALYVLGLVESIVDIFGFPPTGQTTSSTQVLPQSYWYELLYGTVVLLLCLLVCLVGADIYAKASFIIFLIVILVLGTIFISFFAVSPKSINITMSLGNTSEASFTGFKLSTLKSNLPPDYVEDYTTGKMMNFAAVFAVMFNGCTGIMAGSNMSGDLKNPSYSIPRGTITAVIFTYIIYNILSLMISCTCERLLLQKDYDFLKDINVWHPFVIIGIYSSTLSAAMSNLIGASRILYALAKDDIFGKLLMPAKKTSRGGNPWAAVLISWVLVQLVLFTGKLNTIAGIVTIFFLLVYAAMDLACLALEWASAPNFRPTFRYFTWYTCVLGIIGCGIMMFLISPIYASSSIAFMLIMLLVLHYVSPSSSWGYISQALIFHQVRKYLLMLDVRKDHVKFWRPQILLMVANPRTSTQLISFTNDLKKSGLFVLGHVQKGNLDEMPSDPLQAQYDSWLSLVDALNVKSFVSLTLSDSVRHGVQHLLFISGLGGMRPNTLILGFYDDCVPENGLQQIPAFTCNSSSTLNEQDCSLQPNFPPARNASSPKALSGKEYVAIISDSIKMLKNVCLARYFCQLNKTELFSRKNCEVSIDVWPLNPLRPDSANYVDTCSLFLLQMACILNMVRSWGSAKLRIFLCVESGNSVGEQDKKLKQLLSQLRIKGSIKTLHWDNVAALHWHKQMVQEDSSEGNFANTFPSNAMKISDDYLMAVNRMILEQGAHPAIRFLYLPRPPADITLHERYLEQLDIMTKNLGPTLLIHGISAVTSTDL
ncbi:solute carrier family 12 member 9 [Carcharodon carcharias]|uniref:solute carrier family 12 member 9 n=1 Tax=Carcharodon carcharias TaxID=13397 RepID=UPI001B7E472E|nr:solute carrier family 12 member 9 [Carcharodon carcharias]